MTWKKPWDYTPPDPQKTTMADFMLGSAVLRDLLNADANFLKGDMGPQYASPRAYTANLVRYAISLTHNNFTQKYAPSDWDAVFGGIDAAESCFGMLKQLPKDARDPLNTPSVYNAWVGGKGAPDGGHDPIPSPAPSTSFNLDTGQAAAPPGTIL